MQLFTRLLRKQKAEPAHQEDGSGPNTLSAKEYAERFYRANVSHALMDVRTPDEYANGHLTGASNIPLQELPERLGEIPREQPVALYCRTGNRSGQAARMLRDEGFADVYNIGGLSELAAQGLPTDGVGKR